MLRNLKRKIATAGTESNGLDVFSPIRGIGEQDLGHLYINSSSFHFFHKSDLLKLQWSSYFMRTVY